MYITKVFPFSMIHSISKQKQVESTQCGVLKYNVQCSHTIHGHVQEQSLMILSTFSNEQIMSLPVHSSRNVEVLPQ